MYFKNRAEAGRKLASKLKGYEGERCTIVALNDGGILVGAQIALKLHADLTILLNDEVTLPGEHDALASMTTTTFTYNQAFSEGEREEMVGEFHGLIDAQKLEKFHKLNALLADGGDIDLKDLRQQVVILVADALQSGSLLDVAADFLKRAQLKKLLIAVPLASVDAVDCMHLIGDEIFCLSVSENLMNANHYYDENIVPDRIGILKIIRNLSPNWMLRS